MKKILLDPSKKFYKANLHCHSVNSDGRKTPDELKKMYTEKGYSVIAFTDHEHLIDNSNLSDENFLAITACEVAVKEFDDKSTLSAPDMKCAHFNFYAKEPHNIDTPCYNSKYDHFLNDNIRNLVVHSGGEYKREYTAEGINDMISRANECGFLVTYNHPRWSLENAADYLRYKNLWAVEIYNNASTVGGIYEYDINAYDDFLRNGCKIACTACDDNHNRKDDSFGGYVMVNAADLSYTSIINAMENRNLYACIGDDAPQIKELSICKSTAHIKCENALYVSLSTKGRRAERVDARGGEAEFKICENDGYIRFDILGKNGSRTNTCAYFLDEIL